MSSKSVFLAALLAAAPSPALAQAQEPTSTRTPEVRVDERSLKLATDRDREMMHPDLDPVRIIGNEELDNDFRSRTPRLGSNTEPPVLIDEDEAYLRRIAMYEQQASFTAAIPAAPWSENYVEPEERDPQLGATHPNAETEDRGPDHTGTLLVLIGAASLIAVGLHSKRG